MLLDEYNKSIDQLIEKVRTTQYENIIKAGQMIANAVENGGNVYLSNICHSMEKDLIYRGGGPIFYKHFSWNMDVEKYGRVRDRSDIDQNRWGMAEYALKMSTMRPGDILMLSSVSGRTVSAVDLAYEAKKMGITVIAFTSVEYSNSVEPVHPSGMRFYEMADIVIDNCAPVAEGMIQVPGIEAPYAAASGIACNILLWSITSVAVEAMMLHGKTPGILKSANYPGGNDYNTNVVEPHYEEFGW